MIRRAGEVRGTTVDGKDVTRHIIPGTHPREELGIALGYRSELRVPVFARRGDVGNSDVVDHPPFVPATLVVMTNNGEMSVNTSLNARGSFGLQHDAHGTHRRQSAICAGDTQLHVVVHSRKNGRKHVRFETGCVQQVVLEQLAGVVRFVEHLQWQIRMRSVGQLSQPILPALRAD